MSITISSLGRGTYQLAFQIAPIFFTNGIAGNFGGMLPVPSLLDPAFFETLDLDNAFAHFTPMPGGKLANYSVGTYPFANQSVAANAIITEPLTLSMKMSIPVKAPGGHALKLVAMMALKTAVAQHANLGGTYTICTPGYIYTDGILTGLTDISEGNSPIPQNTWQWDFMFPRVTLQQAQAAQSTFMQSVTNGTPTNGSLNAPATTSAIPSITTGTTAMGTNVPAGVTGNSAGGTNAPAPLPASLAP